MATLEDKLLGEKLENYCSSDEDEGSFEDAIDSSNSDGAAAAPPPAEHYTEVESWSGSSANTGPKGVIKDWQRFKQLESEKNEAKERERLMLMKKLSITTQTKAEEQKQKDQDELDAELNELLNEDVLLEFQKKRMAEMLRLCNLQKSFGQVVSLLNGDQFIEAIDKESKLTKVIVHLYENHLSACKTMNKCLDTLAQEYVSVKFCKIISTLTGMSAEFKKTGLPALLVYKNGNLIGNFVRISDELGGDDFYASDVESFLIEHAMLPDKSHMPVIVNNVADDDDD